MTYVSRTQLAKMIDHTLLKAEASEADIVKLCNEAETYGFWSVCVNPFWVRVASRLLAKTDIRVCSVVGFPLGATTAKVKAIEAEEAIGNGAREVDMVIDIGALKSGDFEAVTEEITSVVRVARALSGITVKVVLETGLLSVDEKIAGCKIAQQAGADFVKTCTGFGFSKATVSDVMLLLFLDSGLRRAEMANLQLGDIDLEGKRVRVMGKGGKIGIVPFSSRTAKALWAFHHSPLFPHEPRFPIPTSVAMLNPCSLGVKASNKRGSVNLLGGAASGLRSRTGRRAVSN